MLCVQVYLTEDRLGPHSLVGLEPILQTLASLPVHLALPGKIQLTLFVGSIPGQQALDPPAAPLGDVIIPLGYKRGRVHGSTLVPCMA